MLLVPLTLFGAWWIKDRHEVDMARGHWHLARYLMRLSAQGRPSVNASEEILRQRLHVDAPVHIGMVPAWYMGPRVQEGWVQFGGLSPLRFSVRFLNWQKTPQAVHHSSEYRGPLW